MKARQFLNVLMHNRCGGSLISRIVNPGKHLFYPSTAEAQRHVQIQHEAASATTTEEDDESTWEASPEEELEEEVYDGVLLLPPPKIGFMPSSKPGWGLDFFPFYGSAAAGGENRILCIDHAGMASLFDADTCTVQMLPGLTETKGGWHPYHTVSLCVTDAAGAANDHGYPKDADVLYVMDSVGRNFQALAYGDPDQPMPRRHMGWWNVWHWRQLPLPPVIVSDRDAWCSYAVLHGSEDASSSTILISFSHSFCLGTSVSIGTYCFDTSNGKWAKAGDWALPFRSRGLRLPELGDGLLFGVDNKHFLAMDVFGAGKTNKWAPVLRHAWVDMDIDDLLDWRLQYYGVTYLGEGRFCIHRSFDVMETDGWGSGEERVVVLLTGVEVVRDGSGLLMIKHKSKRLDSNIYDVL